MDMKGSVSIFIKGDGHGHKQQKKSSPKGWKGSSKKNEAAKGRK